ncbi:unnamed protein product [Candida verbasci]|uniref:Uncharacterized protein n=1 Tax=Candida verbasci TaxID=1227364 RepID=A0A9W4U0R2_9ASCO|nr:unnamed protein product [Candida verbasci]
MFKNRYSFSLRTFKTSSILFKDEKTKALLKNLGLDLQKGDINHQRDHREDEDKNTNNHNELDTEDLPSNNETINKLNHMYDEYESFASMSSKNLLFQIALDGDGPFMSFVSNHWLDRKKLLRNLPNKIDVFNQEDMAKVEHIYKELSKLDSDPNLHERYLKEYFNDYTNIMINATEAAKSLDSKFKSIRRKENLLSQMRKSLTDLIDEKITNYNVVGFDKSLMGMPLRNTSKLLPKELVQDLQFKDNIIELKKFDVNVSLGMDPFDRSKNIDPKKNLTVKEIQEKNSNGIYHHDSSNSIIQRQQAGYKLLSNRLNLPKQFIKVDNIINFKRIEIDRKLVQRLEKEVNIIKKTLEDEISTSVPTNTFLLEPHKNIYLKTNEYLLCEFENNIDGTWYKYKQFNYLPNYSTILPFTVSTKRRLKNHLIKIFLINIQNQIDTLLLLKYQELPEMTKFKSTLMNNIKNTIKFRLWRYFSNQQNQNSKFYDAILFKPFTDRCFKRIYWVSKPFKFGLRKSNMNLHLTEIQ